MALASSSPCGGLTVKLRGRPEAPLKRRGRTLSSRARGDTTAPHGPLQRLLDGATFPLCSEVTPVPKRETRRHQRNTKQCRDQVDEVADAVSAPPPSDGRIENDSKTRSER